MSEQVYPVQCPTCGLTLVDDTTAAQHYQIGCVTKDECETCGVPLPFAQAAKHRENCIGQTPHILHNVRAGMVIYLTEEEWTAVREGTLSEEMATQITSRAVYGVELPTVVGES
ncbi:hypothetical protein PBI_DEWDROP_23 [Microbacterium phage Dewdrop]|nr:hypothetical protein PBI_LEAF_23 [Microbacterium phage Leaf]QGZ17392.1 hypothetical protein PBI_DEWDROP_23 [Microbacterium phage Dewdrop]